MDARNSSSARIAVRSAMLASLLAATAVHAADTDPISDYLADLSAGAVSAGEILGLQASAISTIQSPKDFVAALNALSGGGGKTGFGLSVTPARTKFAPVSITSYRNSLGSRAWAGTSFSYAQNTNTQGGIDYKQYAYAVHTAFYLNKEDDPSIAANVAFGACKPVFEVVANQADRLLKLRDQLRKEGVAEVDLNERAKARLEKEETLSSKALPAYRACVEDATRRVKDKWNASQLAFTLGEGFIQDPASGSPRLSLGRHVSLAIALGPNVDSLVNITLRRISREVDLATIATTPSFGSSTLVGARWTYRAVSAQDLFAIAEVSNAKSATTISSQDFKAALGVDKRLAEGAWIQLRVGRNRTQDGKSDQTTALMSLKLSPSSTLPP